MKREIKFRGKRIDGEGWAVGSYIEAELNNGIAHSIVPYGRFEPVVEVDPGTVGQFTGLKDKNGNICIFEGDLLSLSGDLIGNKYENQDLLKDRTNLIIDGLCTEEWIGTYQEAIKRGCVDAK